MLPIDFWEQEKRRLLAVLTPRLAQAALHGMKHAAVQSGIGFNSELANESAGQWAQQYTDQLLSILGTTNEKLVGDALADWTQQPGATMGDLVNLLTPKFERNKARADLIAVTETTRAYANGNKIQFQEQGIQYWRWNTNHDELVCEWCGPLNRRVIRIGDQFALFRGKAVTEPPFHPGCRCWISPVVDKEHLLSELVNPKISGEIRLAQINPAKTVKISSVPIFKETKGAEKWALNNIIDPTEKDKVNKLPEDLSKPILVKYDGMSAEHANEVNKSIAILHNSGVPLPKKITTSNSENGTWIARLMDGNLEINTTVAKDKATYLAMKQIEQNNYSAENYSILNDMKRNIDQMSENERKNLANYDEYLKFSRWSVGDSLADTINHEMGHQFENNGYQPNNIEKRVWYKMLSEAAGEVLNSEEYKYKLSASPFFVDQKYTKSEIIAESFAAYCRGEYNNIGPKMLEIFKRWLG